MRLTADLVHLLPAQACLLAPQARLRLLLMTAHHLQVREEASALLRGCWVDCDSTVKGLLDADGPGVKLYNKTSSHTCAAPRLRSSRFCD